MRESVREQKYCYHCKVVTRQYLLSLEASVNRPRLAWYKCAECGTRMHEGDLDWKGLLLDKKEQRMNNGGIDLPDIAEVKSLWVLPEHGDVRVNGLLKKGWALLGFEMDMSVRNDEIDPSILWVLGKPKNEQGE